MFPTSLSEIKPDDSVSNRHLHKAEVRKSRRRSSFNPAIAAQFAAQNDDHGKLQEETLTSHMIQETHVNDEGRKGAINMDEFQTTAALTESSTDAHVSKHEIIHGAKGQASSKMYNVASSNRLANLVPKSQLEQLAAVGLYDPYPLWKPKYSRFQKLGNKLIKIDEWSKRIEKEEKIIPPKPGPSDYEPKISFVKPKAILEVGGIAFKSKQTRFKKELQIANSNPNLGPCSYNLDKKHFRHEYVPWIKSINETLNRVIDSKEPIRSISNLEYLDMDLLKEDKVNLFSQTKNIPLRPKIKKHQEKISSKTTLAEKPHLQTKHPMHEDLAFSNWLHEKKKLSETTKSLSLKSKEFPITRNPKSFEKNHNIKLINSSKQESLKTVNPENIRDFLIKAEKNKEAYEKWIQQKDELLIKSIQCNNIVKNVSGPMKETNNKKHEKLLNWVKQKEQLKERKELYLNHAKESEIIEKEKKQVQNEIAFKKWKKEKRNSGNWNEMNSNSEHRKPWIDISVPHENSEKREFIQSPPLLFREFDYYTENVPEFVRKYRMQYKVAEREISDEDEDMHLTDEDMDMINEYGNYTQFLNELKPMELEKYLKYHGNNYSSHRKTIIRKPLKTPNVDAVNSDDEANYESKPRVVNSVWTANESKRLPIKLQDGRIEIPDEPVIKAVKKVIPEAAIPVKVHIPKEPKIEKPKVKLSFSQTKEKLAFLANEIMESPEKNIKQLTSILELAKERDPQTKKLALLTLLAVFKDIIPGYRIRRNMDEDITKLSKQVKQARSYEESLLLNYQTYLQTLEDTVKAATDSEDLLILVSVKCMTELLCAVPHFNYRINLLTAVVSYMPLNNIAQVSVMCCNCICTLFQEDESGEVSLEAVKLITKMIKTRGYKVPEHVIKSFLHLRLVDELVMTDQEKGIKQTNKRKKDKDHVSKKARKVIKVDAEVEKELKEAEAVYDKEAKRKMHSETLKFVFLSYFRILKNAPGSLLLSSVLEGLSRFAHLINIDFFSDLLNVLKKISIEQYEAYIKGNALKGEDARNAFHCVIAAFQILTGQGEALNIDLKDFYTSMYTQMMRIALNPTTCFSPCTRFEEENSKSTNEETKHFESKTQSEMELLIHGFELMFYRRKLISSDRIASFVKRFSTMSLCLPSNAILSSLAMIRSLFIKFPRLDSLLDVEGRLATGIYAPYLEDPDLCNTSATNLWEITLLMNHYHPLVRSLAKHISEMNQDKNRATLEEGLNLPCNGFLTRCDPIRQGRDGKTLGFHITPSIVIPSSVKQFIKRKKENGLKRLQGPRSNSESEFVLGLRNSPLFSRN